MATRTQMTNSGALVKALHKLIRAIQKAKSIAALPDISNLHMKYFKLVQKKQEAQAKQREMALKWSLKAQEENDKKKRAELAIKEKEELRLKKEQDKLRQK